MDTLLTCAGCLRVPSPALRGEWPQASDQRALQRQFGTPATLAHLAGTGDAVDILLPLLVAPPDRKEHRTA